ncbi:V-type proton ATPase subunit F [Wallemia ichthyophaga EXF-994]|uniref:V-type proton ATPase subunit F n=1 Tax=Wallemia ichthyophaga (strain EXF-994 / CBS 113033) TaxID=1299270 RepID=R9AHU1_WALI9|nr:V-type proton ATPase subunit F [Wallemia ichthyophaga EXF-994]EOQ99635.1 V-type proton ATPase subunit F [Wallemia ichthyophaga EXF-994]TIA75795.1 hypothetical protein E3P91_00235 [Wallemia ichthyophaga]TIB42584.1 hypothetical protein E3P83_01113 [Wallemia ichthyophaga]TIB60541.1 hypothetical protein E3P79_01037 [Wallemia ichthyophaga]
MATKRTLIAAIGDDDTITGLLLAGIGNVDEGSEKKQSNFYVHEQHAQLSVLEDHFRQFTQEREDIAILLINQHIAELIRPLVEKYTQPFPALLEIPSKEHPYDPEKDTILKRVQKLVGD